MSCKLAACLAVGLCLALTVTHAQTVDSAIGKVTNFPSKLFSRISGQTANMNQQLTRQTEKYLQKMARKETKLRAQLYKTDSAKAAALYPNDPQQQYAAFIQKFKQDSSRVFSSMGPEYLPHVDSLNGMLGFLSKNPSLLKGGIPEQAQVQAALAQVQQLQSKLQQADIIKQFAQARKAQIQQYLSQYTQLPSGVSNTLQGYNREAYYFAEQIREYRQMLNDPDKMMQTALGLLQKLPAFNSFMQRNSFLAGIFGVPAGYDNLQGPIGYQTRDQVMSMIKSQVSQGGSSGAAAIQNSLNTAKQDITNLQNKLSSLGGGSGDMPMPNFKPNDQRTKTLFQRLEYGTYFQTTPATTYYPSYSDLGLTLSYKLGHQNLIGIGASYKLGWGQPIQHIALSSQGVGLRSFIDIHVKTTFSLTGGYELNYLTPFSSFQDIRMLSRWTPSGLIGVTKTVSMKSTVFKKTQISLLWDFLSYQQTPRTQPFVFRVGYSF
jgi:multidrug efflux pump subunit AcrA (membrane-fusion protein)